MNVILLGGFLGSGKTTALMKFAHYLAGISEPERKNKVVIIENEIGEVGIDDQYLRGGGFKVENLFAGCACCTVSGELLNAVSKIKKEMDPQWLVVETTGVAFPQSIQANLMQALKLDSTICVLADASRWARLRIPLATVLEDQIKGSDAVLINKTDLVSAEVMNEVERDIFEIEPNTRIIRISAIGEIPCDVWRDVIGAPGECQSLTEGGKHG